MSHLLKKVRQPWHRGLLSIFLRVVRVPSLLSMSYIIMYIPKHEYVVVVGRTNPKHVVLVLIGR